MQMFSRCAITLLASLAVVPLGAGQGGFLPVDNETVPGPGDNMVVIERGRAQYVVTLSTSGNLAYTHRVDPSGQMEYVSQTPTGSIPRAIALAHDGDYAVIVNSGEDSASVMAISDAGVLTEVGRHWTGGDNPFDVAVAFDDLVVVANRDSDNVVLFGINKRGVMTHKQTLPAGVDPHVVTIDPQGLVAVANATSNDLSLYELDRKGHMRPPETIWNTGGGTPVTAEFADQNGSESLLAVAFRKTGEQDRLRTFEVRKDPKGGATATPRGDATVGLFATDIETTRGDLLVATVNADTGRDQVVALDADTLTVKAQIEFPGAPSFKKISSAAVKGPHDLLVFVTGFQGNWLRSLRFAQ